MKNYVDQYNAISAVINQRITEALTRATGENVEADPRIWQAWWEEYLCDSYELEQHDAQGEQTGSGPQRAGGQSLADASARSQVQQRPLQQYRSVSNQYVEAPAATQMAVRGVSGSGQSAKSTPYPSVLNRNYVPSLTKYRSF